MPLEIERIRALCFDVDGTLRDTDEQWVQRLERPLRPLRFLLPGRQERPLARWLVMGIESPGNLVYHLLDRLNLDDDLARLLMAMNRRRKHRLPADYRVIPGIEAALGELHQRFPMAIISARDEGGTLGFLEASGLRSFFGAVASAQTCQYTKPFPHPILWAAQQMGVAAHECLMIGDTTVDICAGKAAGAQTVGVLCGFGYEKELRKAGVDLILNSITELVKILV